MKLSPPPACALQRWSRKIGLLAVTLWVGSLWSVGFLAVPVLFHALPDRMLAGMLAGKMFTLVAYVGIASGCIVLVLQAVESGRAALRQPVFLIAAGMLLALAGEFGLQPEMANLKALAAPGDVMHSAFAARFQALHHIATGLYAAQSLLGIALVLNAKRC